MSTKYFNEEELKEIANTIFNYIVEGKININVPSDYSFLYEKYDDKQKQEIYLNNIFNRINYINSLAFSVAYREESTNLNKYTTYIKGLGCKHYTIKELLLKLDNIVYNLDYFNTIEINKFMQNVKEELINLCLYYDEVLK